MENIRANGKNGEKISRESFANSEIDRIIDFYIELI